MLFNSFVFLIFAVVFFGFWPLAKRTANFRYVYLFSFSFLFYGWAEWWFLILLIGTGIVDFCAGLAIEKWPDKKKWVLAASMTSNLGVLCTFKYLGFFTENINAVLDAVHAGVQVPVVKLILPVGISFYTFQSLSYTIDVYKGHLKPARNPLQFFAFISLFPQLVAGPIERATHLLPQMAENREPTKEMQWDGLRLIAFGYFKKVVIADNIAPAVNVAFGSSFVPHSGPYWWTAVTMFAVQIYCDFSGYSDIARGLAKWIGFEFIVNFNRPYAATSMRDFWQRWHISLSTWFRDYVYIPLGGSRLGEAKANRNMWITMLVSGFWHGAAWTYIIWGALHGAYLHLERITKWPKRLGALPGGKLLNNLVTMVLVLVAWLFFRANSFQQAISVLSIMFNPTAFNFQGMKSFDPKAVIIFLGCLVAWGWHLAVEGKPRATLPMGLWKERLQLAALLAACVYLRGPGGAFIYFAF